MPRELKTARDHFAFESWRFIVADLCALPGAGVVHSKQSLLIAKTLCPSVASDYEVNDRVMP